MRGVSGAWHGWAPDGFPVFAGHVHDLSRSVKEFVGHLKKRQECSPIGGPGAVLTAELSVSAGTIDIGASATRFANVYAATLNGNIVASNATVGNLIVGNVNISSSAVTVSGNALATQSFVTSYVQTAGKNSQGNRTISTSAPSGPATDGDIWYQV